MNVTLFFSVHVTAYIIGWAQSLDERISRTGSDPLPEVNWFIPLHRDLRPVYGYHINFNLKVYKLATNNLCTNLWSNPFSYLFNGQTKERKECINV